VNFLFEKVCINNFSVITLIVDVFCSSTVSTVVNLLLPNPVSESE
jgi:hypothetical protein